jgi:hypothetical protein
MSYLSREEFSTILIGLTAFSWCFLVTIYVLFYTKRFKKHRLAKSTKSFSTVARDFGENRRERKK